MEENIHEEFSEEQKGVLKSVRVSRIILPIIIGIGVVVYMLWQQIDEGKWLRLQLLWSDNRGHILFWVSVSFLILIIRHIAYATRLRILSEKVFSWKKCVELIFIWEFSSAVSPTSLGGSAVALFVLAQEKLSTAKTTTLVLYSAVLDTMFFIFTLPLLYWFFGEGIIRPDTSTGGTWTNIFYGAYLLMLTYGSLFFYGLFINPKPMKRLLVGFTKLGFLKKHRRKAVALGNDFIIASKEMKRKKMPFHIGAFLATATAWSCRFLLLNCLVMAFVVTTSGDFLTQFKLYARLETMFVVMAFSPTPGAVGVAEFTFASFTADYISNGEVAIIIAFIWRLFTYYLYLFVGVVIVPNWLRNVMNERKKLRTNK